MSSSRQHSGLELDGVFLSDLSIKQPVLITMVMLLTIVMGLLAYVSLPVNLFPDFSISIIAVTIPYPGASPDSVAEQVAEPIENELTTISGIKNITSTSNEGVVTILVEFETNIDADDADADVREKVNAVLPRLPREVEDPIFQQFDPNELPILSIAVAGDGTLSSLQLRQMVDDEIVPQLQRIQGVGSVEVSGGMERQINVLLDLDQIKARQMLPAQIVNSVSNANANLGLGSISSGEQEISLRAPSMLQTPQDITRVQITGTPYRIGDVATVEDGVADIETYARLDGKDAVTIDIRKQADANVVDVADSVKDEMSVIFARQAALEYFIARDDSEFVQESTKSAIDELFVATFAAMLVVFIFFRNVRNTLVTAIGLPVILIGTFAAIQLFGLTINMVTLLALSLSVGLVIDDAIVVRENIFRHLERGELPIVAASRGTAEVSLSVLAMTLTVVAVFVPVTFTTGITGIIFGSFGITIACAMLISLVEAFTLAPMTSAHFFAPDPNKSPPVEHATPAEDHASDLPEDAHEKLDWMARGYAALLAWSLRHRLIIVVLTVVILVVSVKIASGLKMSFFPQQDRGEFAMSFESPPGTPLEETNRLAMQAEAMLLDDPDILAVQTTVGSGGQSEVADIFVILEEDVATAPTQDRLRQEMPFLPRLAFSIPSYAGNNTGITGREVQLSLQSNRQPEELEPLLRQIVTMAHTVPGLVDIDTSYTPGKPELQFLLDPTKAGDLGLTNDDIATSIRTLVEGEKAAVFRENGEDTDIVVRLQPGDRASVEDLRSISVPTMGGSVPLGTLVDVQLATGPTSIRRYNQLNQILIGANIADRNINDVQAELQAQIDQIDLPDDIALAFVGDSEDQSEGFGSLLVAMGLSVLFVYMVLASQFGSFSQPLVIMLAMPFSFIGSFLALQMLHLELDILGMIGLIMLMGLVVKNSILMVDFTNSLRQAGMSKHAALERAGAIRLRPILMTAFALIVGSLPIAIGLGEGSEIRRGLSVVVIGGMITSTVLTLLVVPTAYSLLEGMLDRIGRLFRRRTALPKAAAATDVALASGNGLVTPSLLDPGDDTGEPVVKSRRKTVGRASSNGHRKRRTSSML